MDSTAVDRIGRLAVEAAEANILTTDSPAIVLTARDGTQRVESLEHLQPGRSRLRGKFASTSLQDFADFVVTRREVAADLAPAQGFIDTDKMAATVYFNLGDHEHPGHGDHLATLALKPTAAYAAMRAACSKPLGQRELHDFLEDWRDNTFALYDGATDDGKPYSAALAAVRDITIETARSVNSVERDMGATRSAMESVDAKSKLVLPSGFLFKAVPYEGLQERTFTLRLGVNTGGDKLNLVLRIQQAEAITEAIAKDFRDRLAAKLGAASSLTLGTFTP